MESPSLVNVPAEILHLIIQSLDPVSLIDLSQTSSFLRWFINPQPTHFVQRLLAFELTPEHGGIVPHFRARLSTLSPPTDSQEWNSNKYACTGCMKLLPHQMFDNHSILGLGLRKPPHGSEEGERLTDWEPQGDPVARWKRLQSRGPAERERLEKSRQQYISAIRCNRPVGVQGFLAGIDDDARDDALAEAAEKVLCGRSRHKRLCIECKRKRGFYTRRTRSNIGSSEVPVIKSRQLQFADALSRSFSRTIYPDIPEPPSPRIFRVQRPQARSSLITTLMVFCRHCSTWQELADFRAGTECPLEMNTNIDDPKKSKYLSKLRCNNCFALENGSEKLGAELVQIFTNKAEEELDLIQRRLQFGWGRISTEFCEKGSPLNRPKYKATLRCILDPYHNRDVKRIRSRFESSCEQAYRSVRDMDGPASDPQVASTEDSAVKERLALRRRLKHFRRFLDKEADSADRHRVTDSWQGSWIEDYEDNEACIFYVHEVTARIKANPWLLVHCALDPDRLRYPRPPITAQQQKILEVREEAQHKLAEEWSTNRLPYYRRLVKKGRPWRKRPESHDNQDQETEEYDDSGEDTDEFMEEQREKWLWRWKVKF